MITLLSAYTCLWVWSPSMDVLVAVVEINDCLYGLTCYCMWQSLGQFHTSYCTTSQSLSVCIQSKSIKEQKYELRSVRILPWHFQRWLLALFWPAIFLWRDVSASQWALQIAETQPMASSSGIPPVGEEKNSTLHAEVKSAPIHGNDLSHLLHVAEHAIAGTLWSTTIFHKSLTVFSSVLWAMMKALFSR